MSSTEQFSQAVPWALSLEVKRSKREADHSSPNVVVKLFIHGVHMNSSIFYP